MPPLPARSSLPFDDAIVSDGPSALQPNGSDPSVDPPKREGTPAAEPLPATYDAALAELERLVGAMEAGKLPLEQLLVSYRRGADLLEFCRGRLESVEQQVKVLDEGRLKPWTGA